jgi:hypothetical protein
VFSFAAGIGLTYGLVLRSLHFQSFSDFLMLCLIVADAQSDLVFEPLD